MKLLNLYAGKERGRRREGKREEGGRRVKILLRVLLCESIPSGARTDTRRSRRQMECDLYPRSRQKYEEEGIRGGGVRPQVVRVS